MLPGFHLNERVVKRSLTSEDSFRHALTRLAEPNAGRGRLGRTERMIIEPTPSVDALNRPTTRYGVGPIRYVTNIRSYVLKINGARGDIKRHLEVRTVSGRQ